MQVRFASVVVLGAMSLTADAGGPKGRVVRIEQPRGVGIPRLCKLTSTTKGVCAGVAKPGERIVVVDKSQPGIAAELVIERVTPSSFGRCENEGPKAVDIVGKLVSGSFDPSGDNESFRNLTIQRNSRVVRNQALPAGGHGDIVLALDADDDGTTDVALTKYTCNRHGAPDPRGNRWCHDTFRARDGRLERVDQIYLCQ